MGKPNFSDEFKRDAVAQVYGYRKLHDDLLDHGETCCPNRVARLTRLAGIRAQVGCKRRPGSYGGKPSLAVDNTLDRQFDVAAPDRAWVTDITYIRTLEGFAYLAVVIDLYSRGQEGHDRFAPLEELAAVSPGAVGCLGQRHPFRIAAIPAVLGHADFLDRGVAGERR